MISRRLLLVAALLAAPLIAACSASPTGPTGESTTAASDTTGRRDQTPWN